jgi:flagellar L-ring protein precursor FlgH
LKRLCLAVVALASLAPIRPASGTSLYVPGAWPALASDRDARHVGDIVTILIYESAQAAGTASSGSRKSLALKGEVGAGHFDKAGQLGLGGSSDSGGSTDRSGRMVAQISATVDAVEPNGDHDISGQQLLHINGERTLIKIRGRARTADVGSGNTLLSSRLANAEIDYDGSGFVSRSARPGIVTRIFSWLGLL